MTEKKIYYLTPSSFCMWVDRAISSLDEIVETHKWEDIYCIHQIVHNPNVVAYYQKKWVIFVDQLSDIKNPNSIIVFSAHWVNRRILREAEGKFKKTYSLECPLVTKVYKELELFVKTHCIDCVFYIWKEWHQEALWVVWYAKDFGKDVYVFLDEDKIPKIPKSKVIWVLSQTTLNIEKVTWVFNKIKEIYPNALFPPFSDICRATFERQDVVKKYINSFDVLVIIWWRNSSNTKELYNVWINSWKTSYFAEWLEELRKTIWDKIKEINTVWISWWASTPAEDIKEVFDRFVKNWFSPKVLNL